jgi:phosphoribosyl-AMP cyclohydrolase / phosphoribosyl-ATP pyrophosphohydrolase
MRGEMKMTIDDVKFDERGLVPAIIQDAHSQGVLMLAYMNAESLRRTLETGETWFWSRSRAQLWHKGETSGHTQRVVDAFLDCDGDALVVRVEPAGSACHTGKTSCFHNVIQGADQKSIESEESAVAKLGNLGDVLSSLYALVETRKRERPQGSYTTYLFEQGLDKILKKLGEEASETIIAAKNEDRVDLTREACDLLYHLIVLLVERGVTLTEVRDELALRRVEQK